MWFMNFFQTTAKFSINSGADDDNRLAQSSGKVLTTRLPSNLTEVAENGATNLGMPQKDWHVSNLENGVSYNYRYTQLQEKVSPKLVPTAHIPN